MSVLTAVVVVHAAHDSNNNNTLIEYGVTIDGNRPHRCYHVPSKVKNIDSTPHWIFLIHCNRPGGACRKLSFPGPHLIRVSLVHSSVYLKWHLDQFSRF